MEFPDQPVSLIENGSLIASTSEHSSISSEELDRLKNAEMELKLWKDKELKANNDKGVHLLAKLDAVEEKEKAQKLLTKLTNQKKETEEKSDEIRKSYMKKLNDMKKCNSDLKEQIQKMKDVLEQKHLVCEQMKEQFMIQTKLQEKKVKYTCAEKVVACDQDVDDFSTICCKFTVVPKPAFTLKGGRALITFEEEDVATKILKMRKHEVSVEDGKMNVKALPVILDTGAKFEINMDISRKKVKVNEIPRLPVEHMEEKLELNFYKPSRGGGEIEDIDYDREAGSAVITFAETGVAEHLTSQDKFKLDINGKADTVHVSPCIEKRLEKFQTFCGTSQKTVLLSEIKDLIDPEDLQDMLEIHFQKPSNGGGEVEAIKYVPLEQSVIAYLEEDAEEK